MTYNRTLKPKGTCKSVSLLCKACFISPSGLTLELEVWKHPHHHQWRSSCSSTKSETPLKSRNPRKEVHVIIFSPKIQKREEICPVSFFSHLLSAKPSLFINAVNLIKQVKSLQSAGFDIFDSTDVSNFTLHHSTLTFYIRLGFCLLSFLSASFLVPLLPFLCAFILCNPLSALTPQKF